LSSAQEADFQPVVEPFDSACEEGSAGLTEHEGHAARAVERSLDSPHSRALSFPQGSEEPIPVTLDAHDRFQEWAEAGVLLKL